MKKRIILASSSPRRKELLKFIVDDFEIISKDVDESILETDPAKMVETLAKRKAEASFEPNSVVLGSDTVVALNGEILGKPKDKTQAKQMLKQLSSNSHYVYTGFCILSDDKEIIGHEKTEVVFDDMTDKEIEEYIDTKEPMDKAGAYGIQGYGAKFIKKVNGCYFCVMGFPINRIYSELKRAGLL